MLLQHTCQPPEYKNQETSRNIWIVRMSFSTMSMKTLRKSPERPSECSRRLSVRTAFTYRIAILPIIFNKLLSDSKVKRVLSISYHYHDYSVGNYRYISTALAIWKNYPQNSLTHCNFYVLRILFSFLLSSFAIIIS